MQKLQSDAGAVMEQRRAQLDLELVLEATLNAEDIERAEDDRAAALAERDRRFMKLFADYQLQKTHLARALTDARAADRSRQDAERDAERLRSEISKLQVAAFLLFPASFGPYAIEFRDLRPQRRCHVNNFPAPGVRAILTTG